MLSIRPPCHQIIHVLSQLPSYSPACRSQQGPSGVQTIRLTPDALRSGTIFFAFFNVDYFVHQRYNFIFLVSCSSLLTMGRAPIPIPHGLQLLRAASVGTCIASAMTTSFVCTLTVCRLLLQCTLMPGLSHCIRRCVGSMFLSASLRKYCLSSSYQGFAFCACFGLNA